jgi:glycosyltransferase involved in cell wall biosynthesis
MRILHLTKKYPDALGGDAVVVANLEAQQARQGMEVFVLTHHCPEVVKKGNVETFGLCLPAYQLDTITVKRLLSLLSLPVSGYRYLKACRPDIIHSHSPDLGFAIALPARVLGIPMVNTCHCVPFLDRNLPLLKRSAALFLLKCSGFARIITVDHHSVEEFRQRGIPDVEYIPNGVDLDFWRRNGDRVPGKKENLTFLYVGRLEEAKGLLVLIAAARRLKTDLGAFSILLVGEGPLRPRLEALVDASGLKDHVRFSGQLGRLELREMYHNADIFVLPSLSEGMPLTLLEAWASGLPVIITNVGNVPEVCVNGENAWIIEPGCEGALHEAMLALGGSGELRNRLGRNGMQTVIRYSWGEVATKTVQLYREVCGYTP